MRYGGFAVFAFVLLAGSSPAATPGQPPQSSDRVIAIALPEQWVAFSADVLNLRDPGVTTRTFHRRRDGSSAWVLDTAGGVAITIHTSRCD